MKILRTLPLIVIFGFFAAAAFAAEQSRMLNTKPLPAKELARYQYCGADSDCVSAVNGCCDCANGGSDVAVNRTELEHFNRAFDCAAVVCTQLAVTPPCGTGVVSCINHSCRYFAGTDVR